MYGEYYHLTDSESGKFASWYPILWCAWRYDVTEKAAKDLAQNVETSLDRIYDGNITYFADTLRRSIGKPMKMQRMQKIRKFLKPCRSGWRKY